jgi:hypothetical protein
LNGEGFDKVLVARFSPDNGCYVPEGEILTVRPRKKLPHNRDAAHYFIGSRHRSLKARYGWVAQSDSFTFDDFVRNQLGGKDLSSAERDHLATMLCSISRLPLDTPVTATYFARGTIEKHTVFSVHKVIFYRAPP